MAQRRDPQVEAKAELDACWVCIIGTSEQVSRKLGDNMGGRPIRIVVTQGDPAQAPRLWDRWPYAKVVVLMHFAVRTKVRGEKVRDKLVHLMTGCADYEHLPHDWHDIGGSAEITLPILVEEAIRALDYEAWGEAAHAAKLASAVKRRVPRFHQPNSRG